MITFAKSHRSALLAVFAASWLSHLALQFTPGLSQLAILTSKLAWPWWWLTATTWNSTLSDVPLSYFLANAISKGLLSGGFALNTLLVVFAAWFLVSRFGRRGRQ